MKALLAFVAAAGLVGLGLWWWSSRDDGPAASPDPGASRALAPTAGSAAPAPAPAPAPAAPAPPPATAPAPPAAIAPPTDPGDPVPPPAASSVPFEQEQRDPAWAVDQERELKLRLDRVAADLLARGAKVTVAAAECRRTLCRIDLEATDNAGLSAFYGALETPEGLYGWADQVVLQDVESDLVSREVRTRILVQFDRD